MALHPQERRPFANTSTHDPAPDVAPASDPIQRELETDIGWYRDLVNNYHDVLYVHDLEGRVVSINAAPARLLGYDVQEIVGRSIRDFIDASFDAHHSGYLAEIERQGESHGLLAVLTRAGERRILKYRSRLRPTSAGGGVRGMAHDVTDRFRAEKALRDLRLFRALLDQCHDGIAVVEDKTLRYLDVNQRLAGNLGYSRAELLNMRVHDIEVDANPDSVALASEKPRKKEDVTLERLYRRKDGTTYPVEVSLNRVQLERAYHVSLSRDITERKKVEAELKESERRFRLVYERAPVGVCLMEARTGRFLQANAKYCEIAGRTEDELRRMDFQSITHPEDLAGSMALLRDMEAGIEPRFAMKKRYIRPDGSIRWVNLQVVPLSELGEAATINLGIVEDITDQKQAEEALRALDERERERSRELETILDAVPAPVLIARDPDCRWITANRAAREHLRL